MGEPSAPASFVGVGRVVEAHADLVEGCSYFGYSTCGTTAVHARIRASFVSFWSRGKRSRGTQGEGGARGKAARGVWWLGYRVGEQCCTLFFLEGAGYVVQSAANTYYSLIPGGFLGRILHRYPTRGERDTGHYLLARMMLGGYVSREGSGMKRGGEGGVK